MFNTKCRNEKEAAIALLEAGADPNSQTATGLSPIRLAIHRNSPDVLELLANTPKIDLCAPVCSYQYSPVLFHLYMGLGWSPWF